MSQSQPKRRPAKQRALLRLFNPLPQAVVSDRWWINGHPARILIWSAAEWESLENPPSDAQLHPYGVWCALRIE